MLEAQLRDLIAEDITKLEKGLLLLKKEQYIPNALGTRGFIDLYAQDEQGNHVLIELKKNDAAAREAMNEIYKYVEGVKHHFGVKDKEIRVIVASTEWRELLVPFSRFVSDTKLDVKGLQINMDSSNEIEVFPVNILPITEGRFIAPWHYMYWYFNEESLNEGIISMENSCREKGIQDYVIAVIRFRTPMISEKQMNMRICIEEMAALNGLEGKASELPAYEYIAYFAMQTLSQETCLQILSRDKNAYEEAQILASNPDEDTLCFLHEAVIDLAPTFKGDYIEIGYPAKFDKYFDLEECTLCEIKRYGMFDRNKLLDDDTIVSELKGEDGETGQKLRARVEVSNHAHMESIRSKTKECLVDNIIWRNHILRCLDEIEKEYPMAEIEMSIFNPETGVFTPYYVVTKEDGELYIPCYFIIVQNPEPIRIYFGGCEDNGQALTFKQIIDKYYYGDLSALLMTTIWGGKETRDLDIMEDLGCIYRSFRCDLDEENREFYVLRDDRWRPCEPTHPVQLYYEYLEKNEKLICQIIGNILPRDNFGVMNYSSSEVIFDEIPDFEEE